MKPSLWLFVAILGMSSCAKIPTVKLSEPKHDWVTEFRAKASQRKLYYEIQCLDWNQEGDMCAYGGRASEYPPGIAWYGHLEDGGKPSWWVCGRTQEEAAENLFGAIDGAPSEPTSSKKEEEGKPHRQFIPPIIGGPTPTKADCKTCGAKGGK